MSFPTLASSIQKKLNPFEWGIVSECVHRADRYNRADNNSQAREALKDAVDLAKSHGENNAAKEIELYTYLRTY